MKITWIIERARELLFYPAKTWDKIKAETDNRSLIIYPLALALVQPAAIIVGYGLVGDWVYSGHYFRMSLIDAFYSALVAFFLSILGIAVMGFLAMVIANYFQVESDMKSAAKLIIYSATAPLLAGVFLVIPGIRVLMILGLYGSFLLYIGAPKMMKTTHDKESPFIFSMIIVSIIIMILINNLIGSYIIGIINSNILTY